MCGAEFSWKDADIQGYNVPIWKVWNAVALEMAKEPHGKYVIPDAKVFESMVKTGLAYWRNVPGSQIVKEIADSISPETEALLRERYEEATKEIDRQVYEAFCTGQAPKLYDSAEQTGVTIEQMREDILSSCEAAGIPRRYLEGRPEGPSLAAPMANIDIKVELPK
jgi:pyruvate/oxaloacetate carboxyltransferase